MTVEKAIHWTLTLKSNSFRFAHQKQVSRTLRLLGQHYRNTMPTMPSLQGGWASSCLLMSSHHSTTKLKSVGRMQQSGLFLFMKVSIEEKFNCVMNNDKTMTEQGQITPLSSSKNTAAVSMRLYNKLMKTYHDLLRSLLFSPPQIKRRMNQRH